MVSARCTFIQTNTHIYVDDNSSDKIVVDSYFGFAVYFSDRFNYSRKSKCAVELVNSTHKLYQTNGSIGIHERYQSHFYNEKMTFFMLMEAWAARDQHSWIRVTNYSKIVIEDILQCFPSSLFIIHFLITNGNERHI